MDVMLVGGVSPMMRKLSLKLYKEGHKVYVLSGSRNSSKHFEHAFEQYDFPYSADSVKEVFKSVNPDVTILLGALDSNFVDRESTRESVEYIMGIQNIMLSWSAIDKGRLIYLSSSDVYGKSYLSLVSEEVSPAPSGISSITLLQAEECCLFYKERLDKDVVVLRLDKLYDVPENKDDALLGICERKCLDAFRDGSVSYSENNCYGLTYLGDAVESIYKLTVCENHFYSLYNISSGISFSEAYIVNAIEKYINQKITIVDNTLVGEHNSVILSNQRFAAEFGFEIWLSPDEIIKKTLTYMKKHSLRFLDKSHQGNNLLQRIYFKAIKLLGVCAPYVENLILFIPFFMLNNRATESRYFSKIDFYLIYVLIFAVVYGQRQAIVSALLATVGYIFRQMYNNTGITVMTDYNTYVWIAEVFIVGLVVGYLKDQISFLKEEKVQEVAFLTEREADITDINDSNLRVKEGLITQVVNYNYSLGTVYNMIDKLGDDDPTKIMFRALNLIKNVTGCKDVSLYRINKDKYANLFGYTSETAASMGRRFHLSAKAPLYDAAEKDIVYLNRNMDKSYPTMAYTVYEDGKPDLMVLLWNVAFERMTIDESNRLIVLSKIIRKTVRGAERRYELIKNERFIDGNRVLKPEVFSEIVNTYLDAEEHHMTDFVLLRIVSSGGDNDVSVIAQLLSPFDHIGYGKNGERYVLLTATGNTESERFIAKFREKGIDLVVASEIYL